ncbi:MAG: AI-2E family transporter, partial [Nitrospirae bacterium]|nr:AI-2E family transporter [Nitrospirota bacterium]
MTKAAIKGSNKRYIIPSIIFLLFILIIYFLGNVVFPFFIAALLAYLLNPVVSFLEKKRVPRIISAILIFLGVMAAATIFILIILPTVKNEIEIVINNMPQYIEVLQQRVIP